MPIATSFFNFFPNLKFDWKKLDRDLFKYRIRCLGLKCAKSYEYPPRTSKPSSGRFFTVAGPRALLREMQNKPKNCTDRPKPREMRATAQKLKRMANPAIRGSLQRRSSVRFPQMYHLRLYRPKCHARTILVSMRDVPLYIRKGAWPKWGHT